MAETTRISLLERVRDWNDQESWAEFHALYGQILLRYARFFGLGPDEAEEAASQAMVRLTGRMQEFQYEYKHPGRFRRYLKVILKNVVVDMQRPQAQNSAAFDNQEVENEELAQIELEEAIKLSMTALKQRAQQPKRFEAFYRRVVERESVEQVCAALQMTPTQVYRAKDDMLKALKKCLERHGFSVP